MVTPDVAGKRADKLVAVRTDAAIDLERMRSHLIQQAVQLHFKTARLRNDGKNRARRVYDLEVEHEIAAESGAVKLEVGIVEAHATPPAPTGPITLNVGPKRRPRAVLRTRQ